MQTKKITVLGLCVALAMILSYIESILPVFVGIPGAKLGLPNMVIDRSKRGGLRQYTPHSAFRIFVW